VTAVGVHGVDVLASVAVDRGPGVVPNYLNHLLDVSDMLCPLGALIRTSPNKAGKAKLAGSQPLLARAAV
jgi:hypothetical protein